MPSRSSTASTRAARGARDRGAGSAAVCRHGADYPAAARPARGPARPSSTSPAALERRLGELLEEPAVAIVGRRRAVALRAGGGRRARPRPRRRRGHGGQRPRARDRRRRAPRRARGGGRAIAVLACGADVPYPSQPPRALRPDRAAGTVRVRAAARHAAVPLELPGAQPDHGRRSPQSSSWWRPPSPSGSLITAAVRRDTRPRRRGRARPRHLADGGRLQPACSSDGAPFVSRARRRARPRCSAWASGRCHRGAGPARHRRSSAVLDAVEAGESRRRAAAPPRASTSRRSRAALGRLELMGLVRRDGLGTYERTARG